jgi:hypothetical protein
MAPAAVQAYPGNIQHTQFMDQDGEPSFTAPQVHTVSLPQLHGLSPAEILQWVFNELAPATF